MKLKLLSFLCFLTFSSSIWAQALTKAEVGKEAKFIEALRENAIGRYDKGIKILEELYKEDRTNSELSFELAKAYAATKVHPKVEKHAEIAIKNAPDNVWYKQFYGDYLMDRKLPESAVFYYKDLIRLSPDDKDNYTQLADAYILANQQNKALEVYQTMETNIGPTNNVIFYQFEVLDLMGNYSEAINQMNRLVKRNPQSEEYLSILAQAFLKNKEENKAMDIYRAMLKVDPNNAEANLALIGEGSKAESENAYLRSLSPIIENKSIDIERKVKELIPYIGNLAYPKNVELSDALLELGDRLIQTHPKEAQAHAAYGDILLQTNNIEAAIKQYEITLKLNDKSFAVWQQLMVAQIEVEDWQSLLTTSENAIDIFPNQALGFYFYGIALAETKSNDDAQDILQEGLMIAGKNTNLQSTIKCGMALNAMRLGNNDSAIKLLEEAKSINDQNALTFEYLGDYYQLTGDPKKALDNWQNAQKMGNSSMKLKGKIEANKS